MLDNKRYIYVHITNQSMELEMKSYIYIFMYTMNVFTLFKHKIIVNWYVIVNDCH